MNVFEAAARGNVETYLGDVCSPDDDPEFIADEAYVLAMDGALKSGASMAEAREIAQRVANNYR